jgi:glutathione S-transferase
MRWPLPVLYSFRRCPYAMRARLALAISGSTYELREVVLKAKPPELLEASAKASVPVLVLPDGQVIDQSLDIMHWALEQNDPGRWLPGAQQAVDVLALIEDCEQTFKHHLDRYKYPGRYAGTDALTHRHAATVWLHGLEQRINLSAGLFGPNPALADMAIAPFVRQFAQTDPQWFAEQNWPRLSIWLHGIVNSALFESIMGKYPPWQVGADAVVFTPGRAAGSAT